MGWLAVLKDIVTHLMYSHDPPWSHTISSVFAQTLERRSVASAESSIGLPTWFCPSLTNSKKCIMWIVAVANFVDSKELSATHCLTALFDKSGAGRPLSEQAQSYGNVSIWKGAYSASLVFVWQCFQQVNWKNLIRFSGKSSGHCTSFVTNDCMWLPLPKSIPVILWSIQRALWHVGQCGEWWHVWSHWPSWLHSISRASFCIVVSWWCEIQSIVSGDCSHNCSNYWACCAFQMWTQRMPVYGDPLKLVHLVFHEL